MVNAQHDPPGYSVAHANTVGRALVVDQDSAIDEPGTMGHSDHGCIDGVRAVAVAHSGPGASSLCRHRLGRVELDGELRRLTFREVGVVAVLDDPGGKPQRPSVQAV